VLDLRNSTVCSISGRLMNMECWSSDTDRGNESTRRETCFSAIHIPLHIMGENVFVLYNLPLYIIAHIITVQSVNKIMIY
jgi:hypothetical protein